ncbi:4558_t:CDS:2 [Dentiscutata erythropus]|uniref:4558_t:CDS:1 n=1 Tax=Dentiscutata erythropus TaxID=1348616 RepID=A0A9N9H2K9_9GLOM|nr:4558_t:CDS:2 [Dentiscutata erythropus]
MAGLIQRLEFGNYTFFKAAKVQLFVQRLCPELFRVVSLLIPRTLEDAYNKAKAYKNAYERYLSPTLDKITNFINTIVNQVSDQKQSCQPQSTIYNLNNNRFLYECFDFTCKTPLNPTIYASSKTLVSAAPITQNTPRPDFSITPSTSSTQKDNSISPRNLNNPSLKPFNNGTRFLPAGKHASLRSTQKNLRQQQDKIGSLDSQNMIRVIKSNSKLGASLKNPKKSRGILETGQWKKAKEEAPPLIGSTSEPEVNQSGELVKIDDSIDNGDSEVEDRNNYMFAEYNYKDIEGSETDNKRAEDIGKNKMDEEIDDPGNNRETVVKSNSDEKKIEDMGNKKWKERGSSIQVIKLSPWQNQDQEYRENSLPELAISRLKDKEPNDLRGARIWLLEPFRNLILRIRAKMHKVWKNFELPILHSPTYVARIKDPYLHQWKT